MENCIIFDLVDKTKQEFEVASDQIWAFAEIRYKEYKSSGLLCDILSNKGFRVTRSIAGIETAFMGEFGSGSPVIAFLGEYDALPELSQKADLLSPEPFEQGACGHGCGHHLLGAGSMEAACAVKELIAQGNLHGTVRYYGCPAEEGGAGKSFMTRAGVFDDVDTCLTWHPMDINGIMENTLANLRVIFNFTGISAHAGAFPHLGRSALDAVELTNVGCNYLREHIIPEARMHYAVTDTGGSAPNVVQAHAAEIYCLRAPRFDNLQEILPRVCNVARGAAMMTETKLEIRIVSAYANLLPNKTLRTLVLKKMQQFCPLNYTDKELEYAGKFQALESNNSAQPINNYVITETALSGGSTDVGDVSWVTPTVSVTCAAYAAGTTMHSWVSTAQGRSSIAKKAMHLAACTLASAAAELFENPALIENAKADLREESGSMKYQSLMPPEVQPGSF